MKLCFEKITIENAFILYSPMYQNDCKFHHFFLGDLVVLDNICLCFLTSLQMQSCLTSQTFRTPILTTVSSFIKDEGECKSMVCSSDLIAVLEAYSLCLLN